MSKYGHMPGAHDEGVKENPRVQSKFDRSHGKGLPAPHLKHPGEVARETGSSHPGHTENGHKIPIERKAGNTDNVLGTMVSSREDSAHHLEDKRSREGAGVLSGGKLPERT